MNARQARAVEDPLSAPAIMRTDIADLAARIGQPESRGRGGIPGTGPPPPGKD